MSWAELLKALPDPVSLPGFLLNDEGVAHLITQAEGEDKTNILSTRKRANELKSGKNIPDGLDAEAVQANAEKLVVKLNEIIRAANKKSQEGKKATLEDKLTQIIEEEDKSGLMEFVTTTPVRKWSNKVKDRKKKLLEDNKKAILEFIELDDTDLFYFNTSEFSLTATKPTGDTNWETKINELKSGIENTEATISGEDTITIEFPDVTSWPDMKTVLDIAQIRMTGKGKSKATTQENILLFEKQGKFTKSPLLELYVKGDAPKNVQDKVTDADIKNYVLAKTCEEQRKIHDEFKNKDLKHLSEMILLDRFGKEAFSDAEHKRIRKGISRRLLSTNKEVFPTIPEGMARIDQLREDKKDDNQSLEKIEIINKHLEGLAEDHAKYL